VETPRKFINALINLRGVSTNKKCCYIVSVKVQFFCLPIGQNRVTCRSTKRHVRQLVRNQTFIDRSIIKWLQYACVSTMKFQSSFLKLFVNHLRLTIYPVLVSNKVHSYNRWIIHTLTLIYYITKHLFTETSGKQCVLWPLDRRCCPRRSRGQQRRSRVHKTHCFPRSQ
jgi:hypothetical protein